MRGTRRWKARRVPSYLVESYTPNRTDAIADADERARRAAALTADVEHVRTTFLPDDEVVLHMFEAVSADALRRAMRMAALEYQRVVEAVERSPREEPDEA
jgi:hypothetical protein